MYITTNSNLKGKIGWTLILLSGVPWMLMFVIPWVSIPQPLVVTGVLYGISQILWFVGLWCVGREVLTHVKGVLAALPSFRYISRVWMTVQQRHFVQRQSNIGIQSSTIGLTTQESSSITGSQHLNEDCR